MSNRLPPCDHDECPPSHCLKAGGSLAQAPRSPKIVLVPMSPEEALKLLDNLTKNMPHPLPFNFQHKQWDLMLPNLEALERDISRAKRVLAALSENK